MASSKSDIIARLQQEILPLQGFRQHPRDGGPNIDLGPINKAFPQHQFPLGAIHEFICSTPEDAASTGGFLMGIISALMKKGAVCLWISATRNLFPPGLQLFNVAADQVIFVDLYKERDMLWAMEEALKCEGLAGVIAEIPEISFTASRRLQLAVEQSRVTGFLVRKNPRTQAANACMTRWKITSLAAVTVDELPGLGFPRWQVDLVKVRNGKPGSWAVEWIDGKFHFVRAINAISIVQKRKTG